MIYFLALLFVLSVMILVHELGHFWMARRVGIKVLKFSFGFPPKLFGFKRGDTEYVVQAIPVGGYVKLAGEDAFEDDYVAKPGDYMACPWWGRSLMALAGPLANLATAFLIVFIVGLIGIKQRDVEPVIGSVSPGSVAAQLDLRPGDHILSVNGKTVNTWFHAYDLLQGAGQGRTDHIPMVIGRGTMLDTIQIATASRDQLYHGLSPLVLPRLGDITPGYPAYQVGLMKGDLVLAVNGQPVSTWDQMRSKITASIDVDVALSVLRGRDTLHFTVRPVAQRTDQGRIGMIGIAPPEVGSYVIRSGFTKSLSDAAISTVVMVVKTYQMLYDLVTGRTSLKSVGSILMIGQMAGETAKKGFSDLLMLMAVLSVSLMVMNLLPLPVLDGGVIFFAVLEGIRRKALPVKAQAVIQQVGMVLLIALMALALANDGLNMFKRLTAIKAKASQSAQPK